MKLATEVIAIIHHEAVLEVWQLYKLNPDSHQARSGRHRFLHARSIVEPCVIPRPPNACGPNIKADVIVQQTPLLEDDGNVTCYSILSLPRPRCCYRQAAVRLSCHGHLDAAHQRPRHLCRQPSASRMRGLNSSLALHVHQHMIARCSGQHLPPLSGDLSVWITADMWLSLWSLPRP